MLPRAVLMVATDFVIGDMYMIGDLKKLQKNPKELAEVTFMWQSFGHWMIITGSTFVYTARVGVKNTMGTLCFGSMLSHALLFVIVLFKMWPACEKLNMPDWGSYLNMGLMATWSFLALCGWTAAGKPLPSFGLPSPSDKSALAFGYGILLCLVYGPLMLLDTNSLLDAYNVKRSGLVPKFYELIFTAWGGTLLTAAMGWFCMLSADAKTKKDGIRALWAMMSMQFVAQCFQKTAVTQMGQYVDAAMVNMNIGIWLVGTLVAYRAMVL
eukprot:COSAG01_NODE_6546_length_3613_cov_16.807057_3_plen_268_part_00